MLNADENHLLSFAELLRDLRAEPRKENFRDCREENLFETGHVEVLVVIRSTCVSEQVDCSASNPSI